VKQNDARRKIKRAARQPPTGNDTGIDIKVEQVDNDNDQVDDDADDGGFFDDTPVYDEKASFALMNLSRPLLKARVETKIFVFVFSRKFRENLFSLFAKKSYENNENVRENGKITSFSHDFRFSRKLKKNRFRFNPTHQGHRGAQVRASDAHSGRHHTGGAAGPRYLRLCGHRHRQDGRLHAPRPGAPALQTQGSVDYLKIIININTVPLFMLTYSIQP
jgi:hypothetical protein